MSFPFVIWTLQRTGGTSLTGLLMRMSEHQTTEHEPFWPVRAFGHVTRQWKATGDMAGLNESMASIVARRHLIKHCYEFHGIAICGALARAATAADYRHILLLRRDELARLVSKALADAHGTWLRRSAREFYVDVAAGRRSLKPLAVDQLVRHYRVCIRETGAVRALLKRLGVTPLEIYYEDLYKGNRRDRERELVRIFDYLDFDATTIGRNRSVIYEKIFNSGQATHEVFAYLPNLQELKLALRAAGYVYETGHESE